MVLSVMSGERKAAGDNGCGRACLVGILCVSARRNLNALELLTGADY